MRDEGDPVATAATEELYQSLVFTAEHLDVPEGYSVEIVDGSIIVSPTPAGRHLMIVRRLEDMVRHSLPDDTIDQHDATIEVAGRGDRYVPDLVVLPVRVIDAERWIFPADEALLAVEVTSPSNPEPDRLQKPRGYAAAGVPLYLLVDVGESALTLFRDPVHGAYQTQTRVPWGDKLELPEPFAITIDSAQLG